MKHGGIFGYWGHDEILMQSLDKQVIFLIFSTSIVLIMFNAIFSPDFHRIDKFNILFSNIGTSLES
jgi:hypothetical protein